MCKDKTNNNNNNIIGARIKTKNNKFKTNSLVSCFWICYFGFVHQICGGFYS